MIDNGGEVVHIRVPRNSFQPDREKLGNIEFSQTPIGISDLADRISVCKAEEKMRRLAPSRITGWLCEKGFLTVIDQGNGKHAKRPTSAGKEIGISVEGRTGLNGPYEAVLYSLSAQHFIIDNLDAILNEI